MENVQKPLNIYEKMLAITNELTSVAKNLSVGVGAGKYKAVGEADILAAVKPLEEKYKIYSYPISREVILTSEMATKSGGKNLVLRLKTIYRFVNTEKPEEFIDQISYGDGIDSQDKAPGKAMTYSDKYALMKAYKIITGDDPDQYKSEDVYYDNKAPQNQGQGYAKPQYQQPYQQPQQQANYYPNSQPQAQNQPNYANPNPYPANNQGQAPQGQNPQGNVGEQMTREQWDIICGLEPKWHNFICEKLKLQNIGQLTKRQADQVLEALKKRGVW